MSNNTGQSPDRSLIHKDLWTILKSIFRIIKKKKIAFESLLKLYICVSLFAAWLRWENIAIFNPYITVLYRGKGFYLINNLYFEKLLDTFFLKLSTF